MLSSPLLSAPKKFGYGSVLSVESFLSSSHSHHPTLALWVFSNTAAKIVSCPLLSVHYFLSRSIGLNRETMVYSTCQNTTLFTKREPISANFLCSIEAIWEDSYTVMACTVPCGSNSGEVVFAKMLLAGLEVFKYVWHQVDFTDCIMEHCIKDARKERANETWIPKLLQEWLIIKFHIGSVSTSARQWCKKKPSWYLLPILQSLVSQA